MIVLTYDETNQSCTTSHITGMPGQDEIFIIMRYPWPWMGTMSMSHRDPSRGIAALILKMETDRVCDRTH